MSDASPPVHDSRYGHSALVRDSADVAQWIRHHATEHGFELDPAQTGALQHFERLYEDLIGLERLEAPLVRLFAGRRLVRGIYLCGGVGRGKSFLMDSFLICAPASRKTRIHLMQTHEYLSLPHLP